jgi:hypothetical protein
MKAGVVYWVEEVEGLYEVWAYNSYYSVERLIRSYKTKKAAEGYVTKVNARLQGQAVKAK